MLWLAVAYPSAEACDSMLGANTEVQNVSVKVQNKRLWWERGKKSTQRRHLESVFLLVILVGEFLFRFLHKHYTLFIRPLSCFYSTLTRYQMGWFEWPVLWYYIKSNKILQTNKHTLTLKTFLFRRPPFAASAAHGCSSSALIGQREGSR